MTFDDIKELCKFISSNHSPFFQSGCPMKYMDIGIDFRTNSVYTINLRGYFTTKRFHVGDFIHDKSEHSTMKEAIYSWLEEKNLEYAKSA